MGYMASMEMDGFLFFFFRISQRLYGSGEKLQKSPTTVVLPA
jgi:hypothetical protein